MDLSHSFTVPATVAQTWAAFEDIESVAGCFPGAMVTEVEGSNFRGTCKVKLGPIAMVYTGTGTFVEKDEAARRFVIDAKGKDKRGNGTAGARVTAVLTEEGSATRVDVTTDLAITGRPAQFGRGVIQDVSDKLLQQFVTCLQDRVGAGSRPADQATPAGAAPAAPTPTAPASAAPTPSAPASAAPTPVAPTPVAPTPAVTTRAAPTPAVAQSASEDALDLGTTVVPVLLRSYGKQAAVAALLLLVGWLVGRRAR